MKKAGLKSRVLAMILSFLMVFTSIPTNAFAAETTSETAITKTHEVNEDSETEILEASAEDGIMPIADTYKYIIECNVDYVPWVSGIQETEKPVIQMNKITNNVISLKTTYQMFAITNYASIKDSLPLDYIEIDGLKLQYSEFVAIGGNFKTIDTSSCANLCNETVQIRLYNGYPQIKLLKNANSTLGSDISVKFMFQTEQTTQATLTVSAGEHGTLITTPEYLGNDADGKNIYKITAKPELGYQLSSYTVQGETEPVQLDLTATNYRWNEQDNIFQISIDKNTEITLNFTEAEMELELWSYDTIEDDDSWWFISEFGKQFNTENKDKLAVTFEEHKTTVPLSDELGARFFFKVNIKGFIQGIADGNNCVTKIYSGDNVDETKLIWDSNNLTDSIPLSPPDATGILSGARCGGFYTIVPTFPSDLSQIHITINYAGHPLSATFDVQTSANIKEVKEFKQYYTDTYGLDKQGKEAYTAEEKATDAYATYCKYGSFRYVLRQTYNQYLSKIAAEANEENRKALLAEGKQALDDASKGVGCNAIVFSFIEKDGVKAIPAMAAVPNDVKDYTQHPSSGTTAHIAMIAALEALYPGNWTYTYHVTQFGSFVNSISAGGENDTGKAVISTDGGSTGPNYGFWSYNGNNSDWGVSNYNPFDGDVMWWGSGNVEKNWAWAKLRLYYGSDAALDAALEERGISKSISSMTADELETAFSDLDDGSGKAFFRRYGQFRDLENWELVQIKIGSIGTVNADSGDKIQEARTAYDNLSDEEKAKVTNYSVLVQAEESYEEINGDLDVSYEEALNSVLAVMKDGKDLGVGSLNGEWAVLSLARNGLISGQDTEGQTANYLEAVQTALETGKLKNPTDYARVTLALSALGIDAPTKMIEQCKDYDKAERQGINAITYCLLALNTKPYDADNTELREKYITYLEEHTCNDGGWAFGSYASEADPDITAMVIQSLAPYYEKREDVKKVVDEALETLKTMQKSTGGFESYGTYNAESTAQVIVALTSLGIDPTEWNGNDAVNALMHFYRSEDQMFAHTLDGTKNQMATEQAAYALTAYSRFKAEENTLYDMKDAFGENGLSASLEQAAASAGLEIISEFKDATVSMEEANDQESLKSWITEQINAFGFDGTEVTVAVSELTSAAAGTAENTAGTNGAFTAVITVAGGQRELSVTVTGTITATEYTHSHYFGTEWKTNENQHWKECECGEKGELADHTFEWVVDKEATTEATGLKHEECICGVKRSENTEIEKVATVDVYFSVSEDDKFFASEESGEVVALREITVPYFDLAKYDLEDFSSGKENEITMLHLFLYATEVYYCGIDEDEAGQGYLKEENLLGSDVLDITGSYGSMFMQMFWNMDLNLNYYLNNEYPLEYQGWGATADKIVIHDGDVITLGHFTSWSFFNDPSSIFNYIQNGDDVTTTTAEQGDQVTLTLYHAGADFSGNYTTAHTPIDYCPDVYYISVDELNDAGGDVTNWNAIGQADSEGNIIFDTSDLDAGTYLVAMAGQYGTEITDDICSTPGGILLTITEKEYVQPDKTALNDAIAEAEEFAEEDYTEESWTAFAEALEAAKAAAANEKATQEEVDAALAALEDAADALVAAEKKEPADATDDSKDVPVEMYTATAGSTQSGGDVYAALDGNTSTFWEVAWDIGATNPELLWYQIELEEAVELEALRYYPRSGSNQGSSNGFITDYQVMVSNDGENWTVVSEGSWEMTTEWKIAEFDSPVTAKYVRLFATGTYADVGNNTNMSIAEVRVKSVEKVDYVPAVKKEALATAISKAEALNTADYVDFTAVETALAAAKTVAANEEATQEEVDAAAEALNAAVKALVKAATAEDKDALKAAIDKAEALNAADYVDFTAVETALANAKEVYAAEKASQADVKAATNKLNKAIKALVEVVVEEDEVVRLYGSDRYATGFAVAEELKAVLGVEKFESVIIATGNNFADALSGSYLAAVKNAPILLTNGKAANVAELHAYIKANVTAGGTVYILGGTAAVPESVEAIKEAGYDVQRISGASRYETSLKILEAAGISGNELIVATGTKFADSLSASATGRPIMLVKPNTALTDAQKAMVSNFTKIYVIGGEGAVSKAIETELTAYGTVTRLSGADRYETSVKVAETFFKDADRVLIANGKKFPDGLCGGPLAAALNAPLVLTKDDDTAAAAGYIKGQEIQSGYVLGGTGAISEETVEAVFGVAETK